MFYTKLQSSKGIQVPGWIPLFSACNASIYSVSVVLRSRKRAGRRGMRDDHCLCMISFLWDESLLMPFPAAAGLSGYSAAGLFRKEMFLVFLQKGDVLLPLSYLP